MKLTSEWKPAFNATLAHHILEAYGLKEITFCELDGEAPVNMTFVNGRLDKRVLIIREGSAEITDRGTQLGYEVGNDWIQALVNTLSHAYPPSLCQ